MSRPNFSPLKESDLTILMKGLGTASKAEFAKACGASPNAALPWISAGKIPSFRLLKAAHCLKGIADRNSGKLSGEQDQARLVLESILGKTFEVILKEKLPSARPTSIGVAGGKTYYSWSEEQIEEQLRKLPTERLIDELDLRGWKVTLTRKESK